MLSRLLFPETRNAKRELKISKRNLIRDWMKGLDSDIYWLQIQGKEAAEEVLDSQERFLKKIMLYERLLDNDIDPRKKEHARYKLNKEGFTLDIKEFSEEINSLVKKGKELYLELRRYFPNFEPLDPKEHLDYSFR